MDSKIPMEIVEDDDEFDWEAAVREIDLACERSSNPSTSLPPQVPFSSSSSDLTPRFDASNSSNFYLNAGKKPVTCKQSTLDKFIGRTELKPPPENRTVEGFDDDKVPSVDIDVEAAKTWIYPVNVPLRDYQFAITKTALFSNTLVALPTGLGKTLIAAVVMYNYFRWFPEGKIVFAAPSRPLVMQQIEACHNIVGIPQEWTIDMTGQISPSKRALHWKDKRVFFVTPQVLEKDIQSGTCLAKCVVCLVIDEAHRALGNYAYRVAVRELMAIPVQMRILALTATPGSKTQAIQNIIDNLFISTLEYRNESDHDVSPYVHNRTVELIEVPLGKEAVEINKKLLDVIRPYATRLQSAGLLQNRDYLTLSPCDLLISRDKFRQAPPPGLPHVKHGDVEACFAALITLYHIRKLLSSHGIRPAYEMLEEKLQQGSFARLMSKNEDIRRAKLLMQQSLSQGAPSPKLSKMLEVLVDHFKTKDPKTSRVIIFSNFRGSVRDIMNALSNIGDLVKATEFIGQSSGKALKGQSQKVQQAVLEKFRAGGYNVIVATSIGEEGLDIMEVDLVVCFDANVSPLRMIQRMGRTGRKHDGRVVVLACEGSELKGYMRKQANGRSIKKHMQNGGINIFNFHPSPRMIPHILKPEVQFVELSIEQFIPRGKKMKDENVAEAPRFQKKLTAAETDILSKYFCHNRQNSWRPSLIAFPHFQAIPSKVSKVKHSYRTRMFIDAMQCLQEVTYSEHCKSFSSEMQHEATVGERGCFVTAEPVGGNTKDLPVFYDISVSKSQRKATDPEASPTSTLKMGEKYDAHDLPAEEPPTHCYLFGSDYVSVDALGKVLITSVPSLSSVPHSKAVATDDMFLSFPKQLSYNLESHRSHGDQTMQVRAVEGLMAFQEGCVEGDTSTSPSCKYNVQGEKSTDGVEKTLETPAMREDALNVEDASIKPTGSVEIKELSDEEDYEDLELSPRLTNFIKSGVVPESPINGRGVIEEKRNEELLVPNLSFPAKSGVDVLLLGSTSPDRRENGCWGGNPADLCRRNALVSSSSDDKQTPPQKIKSIPSKSDRISASPIPKELRTPLANVTNSSGSKDWRLSSGETVESVKQARKFKRLRKVRDCDRHSSLKTVKENSGIPVVNLARSLSPTGPFRNQHVRGKRKPVGDVRALIDDEAEVSSEAEMSADEEDDEGTNSCDDSFIDDRTNPTASTQAESSKVDMMAIYRRSLLSQSPFPRRDYDFTTSSPDSMAPLTRINEIGSSSGKSSYSLRTPQTNPIDQSAGRNSASSRSGIEKDNESNIECRKRKFSLYDAGNVPAINLDKEFSDQAEAPSGKEGLQHFEANETDAGGCIVDDDEFYETLDFDAVEAQATRLLRQKSDKTTQKQETNHSNSKDIGLQSAPSFDLGL